MTTNEKYSVIELCSIGGGCCAAMEIMDATVKSLELMDGKGAQGLTPKINDSLRAATLILRNLNREIASTVAKIQA